MSFIGISTSDLSVTVREEISESFRLVAPALSPAQGTRALSLIKSMFAISENFKEISRIETDGLRNGQINKLTHSGAEDGFSSNLDLLSARIQIFVSTYLRAKEAGDLSGFFSCFSRGDPCLSGCTESLYKYAASLDGLDIDEMPDPEKSLFYPGSIFAEIIMNQFESGTSRDEFAGYIVRNLSEIAKMFEKSEKSEPAKAFLNYLEVGGLYKKGHINWESLITELVNSRYFNAVYEQSLVYVV
jgi:hypothetical protein